MKAHRAGLGLIASACIIILMVALTSCTSTFTPGYKVTGRGGRSISQLSTAEQQQLLQDAKRCQAENLVTVSDDPTTVATLAGAAAGVIAAHGSAATRAQAGLHEASNAAQQAHASLQSMHRDITIAAEWKVSDCLKTAGWDSMPFFMGHGGIP